MNKTIGIFLALIALVLTFTVGYKIGDSRGYSDGYNEGYRYDCKEEIGTLYKQVKAHSKALYYTDSSIKLILHENDSLKRQEYYKKRHDDSLTWKNQYSQDSLKYHVVARIYADSLNKAVGGHVYNIIQDDGKRNVAACLLLKEYKNIDECKDGFDLRSRLDNILRKSKRKGRK